MKKICWFVDELDNYKDFICVFDDSDDKEEIADAINKEIVRMGLFSPTEEYNDKEGIYEIGRSLAYNGEAQYNEYSFKVENIKEL